MSDKDAVKIAGIELATSIRDVTLFPLQRPQHPEQHPPNEA